MNLPSVGTQAVIELPALAQLFPALERRGYQVVGPTLRDGAVTYDTLTSLEELPIGWTDEQQAGQYRLKKREDAALFGYGVGPQSWKRFLHPSEVRINALERDGQSFKVLPPPAPATRQAFLGVRACELAAIRVLDRVLVDDQHVDPVYQQRREGVFIVAVNCTRASPNCFCSSMETGPQAGSGFDLALTELATPDRHMFVAEAGTGRGAEVLAEIEHRAAAAEEVRAAQDAVQAAGQMERQFDTRGVRELLYENFEHPRWAEVAARCLSCANCTMVCPTCFCTTVEDSSNVTGQNAERWRKWDSCFTESFSYIHGGSVRQSVKSRYRQWLTHKLAAWVDQFGASGCVGCGRCITWCPVGIDLTEEVAALRGSQQNKNGQGG
jgi:formate hydrogenlyase subunit 6/NADH:ubiquinone oxidoreductase subunit I